MTWLVLACALMVTEAPDRVRFGLHPGGQTQVWKDAARFKVVVSGRRWGKTLLGRTWLLERAMSGLPGRYWYVAPTREDAKDIMWGDLKAAVHPEWLAEPPREGDLALHLLGDREIRLWSAEKGHSLRGRSLRALVMDEYADMDAAVFSEILEPSLVDFRAPALFIGTPKSYNHFYDLYLRGQDPRFPAWASWQFQSVANPFLDHFEIEEKRRTTDERTFRQEYEASFEAMAGRVYWAFDRAKHVKPVTLDRNLPICLAFDFNYNPATAVIGQHVGNTCRVLHEVFLPFRGGEATIASVRACKAWLNSQGFTGQLRLYGDSTGTNTKTTGPSDHQVLKSEFPGATWCIPGAQPNPRDRHASVNSRCVTGDGLSHLEISPSCPKLIGDLSRVIYAANGDVDQKSDPMLTHISDALGYWIDRDWPVVRRGGVAHIRARGGDLSQPSETLRSLKSEKSRKLAEALGRGV